MFHSERQVPGFDNLSCPVSESPVAKVERYQPFNVTKNYFPLQRIYHRLLFVKNDKEK